MRKQILTCLTILLIRFAFAQTDTSAIYSVYVLPEPDSNSSVYNGIEHLGYSSGIEGIAYYNTPEWIPGTLVYRDQSYAGVFLKYDLVKDEVILQHFNGFTGIILFSPRIHSFSLANSKFVNVQSSNGRNGIYQEMATGKIGFYAKRIKQIDERLLPHGVEKKIVTKNAYYLMKDGVLHTVRNEKAVMDLVKDKKNEVRSHLKGSGLKFRKSPEAFLLTVVTYYNQLSR